MDIKTIVKQGTRRVKHELSETIYLQTRIDRTKPLSIRAMVNERCNYRCQYCRFWRMDNYLSEMTISQWENALYSLKQFIGPYTVQFSGGEPFIKKGFPDLLTFCHEHNINWGVITNGSTLNTKHLQRIIEARPFNIDISVDGHTAETHDTVRGISGSLAYLERGIKALIAERDAAGLTFPIRIKPTIHQINFRTLPQLVEWTMAIGATSIDFAPVRPWSDEVTEHLWIEEADMDELDETIEQLLAMQRDGAPIETAESQLRTWPAHFRRERIAPLIVPCRVGLRDYHIRANGDVQMCWHYPVVGNVKTTSAESIWYGEQAIKQRKAMVNCTKLGSVSCANSCLSHRPIRHDIRRVMMLRR